MDSILFWCFSFISKEREGEKKTTVPPPLCSHNPITTSLPCSNSSGDFPEQCGAGMFFSTDLPSDLSERVASRLQGVSSQLGRFPRETASLNWKIRGVGILELNMCGNIAGDWESWLGIKAGFCCLLRRPEQVALDPLCPGWFSPSLPALSCSRVMSP